MTNYLQHCNEELHDDALRREEELGCALEARDEALEGLKRAQALLMQANVLLIQAQMRAHNEVFRGEVEEWLEAYKKGQAA